ncbi:MAG: lytic transglycosylase domain-containing protein [Fibrobacteraceae bacterium]|nr:lytic transglycosylase domain-containing protein [Fibrobacteraceae bacterium]
MKNKLEISPVMMSVFLGGCFLALIVFLFCWHLRQSELSYLGERESVLRGDLEQLNTWGKWTVDYVKISRVIDHLSRHKLSEESRQMLTEQIWQISRSYSIDPLLILAVVAQESHGNPQARGRVRSGKESGAMGLMQIKLETAQNMAQHFNLTIETAEDLMKPEVNVAVGSAYLIRLIGKYGKVKEALIAYNLGHSAVDRMLERGQELPTRYYERVISKYNDLARLSF